MVKIKAFFLLFYIVIVRFKEFYKLIFNFVIYKKAELYYESTGGVKFISQIDLIKNLNETIENYSYLDGTSFPSDIIFLKTLVKQYKNCEYLEIGSYRGESLINIIEETKSSVNISLSKEELRQMFGEQDAEADGCLIQKEYANLTSIRHNSRTFDFASLDKKFDVIFIDGDHSEEGVQIDTLNAFKLLKDENSIIIWHDFGNTVNDLRFDVIAGALKGTQKNLHQYIYRVQNTLCGIFTRKDISSSIPKNKRLPVVCYDINIKYSIK